jgi:hypothetical protein
MNTPINLTSLDRMAWTIADKGFASIPVAALRELGFEARRAGIDPAVAHTLVDTQSPLVLRQRAFGYVAARLAAFWNEPATPVNHFAA